MTVIYVERSTETPAEARRILEDARTVLHMTGLQGVRLVQRYLVDGVSAETLDRAVSVVFADPASDRVILRGAPSPPREGQPVTVGPDARSGTEEPQWERPPDEWPPVTGAPDETAFALAYLPGQFDSRAQAAVDALHLLGAEDPQVRTARILLVRGELSEAELSRLKSYLINPVDSYELDPWDPAEQLRHEAGPVGTEAPRTGTELGVGTEAPGTGVMGTEVPRTGTDGPLQGTGDKTVPLRHLAETDENSAGEADRLRSALGLAMTPADLRYCARAFAAQGREPLRTELRVLDTYWSDHCRHQTFTTELRNMTAPAGTREEAALRRYRALRRELGYGDDRPETLMDMATIAARVLRRRGLLDDLDVSTEVNAAGIVINAAAREPRGAEGAECEEGAVDRGEPWLLLFKNETHNHPTEIEPYGGASTCLGGAIRDPMSGRGTVFQALRVSGGGDPRIPVDETRRGKLPQRLIALEAARGFSSYGNQFGLPTGLVGEHYHPGYIAKRLEAGAVVGAVPLSRVRREEPSPGDVVLLVGGRTGRDGIGGATGSSKEHSEDSVARAGAEVQKGNPPVERALYRLFRRPAALARIKRCNDFGAGGVAVAVGELARGIEIDLDAVPRKYAHLTPEEVALSESQERMAVVVEPAEVDAFRELAREENLEATVIARITDGDRLVMRAGGDGGSARGDGGPVVDLPRELLDSAGAPKSAEVRIQASPWAETEQRPHRAGPAEATGEATGTAIGEATREASGELRHAQSSTAASATAAAAPMPAAGAGTPADWLDWLARPNRGARRGLSERFDASIGRGSVLLPFGGVLQRTPAQATVMRLPRPADAPRATPGTVSLATYGFAPEEAAASPYRGGYLAVVEALCRAVAAGADPARVRLSLQEYFPRPGDDPARWGLPAAALLGALDAQLDLDVPAIGGKDSMSGSFEELDVPPTLIAFAFAPGTEEHVRSPELKGGGNRLLLLTPTRTDAARSEAARGDAGGGSQPPHAPSLRELLTFIHGLSVDTDLLSITALGADGIAAGLARACFGNNVGVRLDLPDTAAELGCFEPAFGAFLLEVTPACAGRLSESRPYGFRLIDLGVTGGTALATPTWSLDLSEAFAAWHGTMDEIFASGEDRPAAPRGEPTASRGEPAVSRGEPTRPQAGTATDAARTTRRPRVVVPVFPGTNCEFDTAEAVAEAGGRPETVVLRTFSRESIRASVEELARSIDRSRMLILPGGFSAGDEPEGSGKFMAAVLRQSQPAAAITALLEERDGLILGICNGFQALVRLGLLPSGAISDRRPGDPVLTENRIGHHVARMAWTRIASAQSPWLAATEPGRLYGVPLSHGEGRFHIDLEAAGDLLRRGQVATQYADPRGEVAEGEPWNPNGSVLSIEGITSPDGRVFGKMGHIERVAPGLFRNHPDPGDARIIESGVRYVR